MSTQDIVKRARAFSKPFRVTDGSDFRLKDVDPGDTLGLGSEDKPRAKEALAMGVERWPSCRTCYMRKTAGRCCSSFRRWMPPGKTAPSST